MKLMIEIGSDKDLRDYIKGQLVSQLKAMNREEYLVTIKEYAIKYFEGLSSAKKEMILAESIKSAVVALFGYGEIGKQDLKDFLSKELEQKLLIKYAVEDKITKFTSDFLEKYCSEKFESIIDKKFTERIDKSFAKICDSFVNGGNIKNEKERGDNNGKTANKNA